MSNPLPRIRNCYKLLAINPTSSTKEIKTAYRKLALLWHPDKNPTDDQAESRFKDLQEAYSVLSDKQRRQDHDREIGLNDIRMRGGVGGVGPAGSKNWNFKQSNKGYDVKSATYRPTAPPKWGGTGFNENLHAHHHYGDEIRSASGKISSDSTYRPPEFQSGAFRNVDLNEGGGVGYVGKGENLKERTLQDVKANITERMKERKANRPVRRKTVKKPKGGDNEHRCVIL